MMMAGFCSERLVFQDTVLLIIARVLVLYIPTFPHCSHIGVGCSMPRFPQHKAKSSPSSERSFQPFSKLFKQLVGNGRPAYIAKTAGVIDSRCLDRSQYWRDLFSHRFYYFGSWTAEGVRFHLGKTHISQMLQMMA